MWVVHVEDPSADASYPQMTQIYADDEEMMLREDDGGSNECA
jgi:hypothetical protein